jgi:hypothetical protein
MFTTGDIARKLGVTRGVVAYAIERAGIKPKRRAGIVRLFGPSQWLDIVEAVRAVQRRQESVG